jgi:hypothetical protein
MDRELCIGDGVMRNERNKLDHKILELKQGASFAKSNFTEFLVRTHFSPYSSLRLFSPSTSILTNKNSD